MFAGPMQRALRPSKIGRSASTFGAAPRGCAGVVWVEKYASKQAVKRPAGRRDMTISRSKVVSHRISAESADGEKEVKRIRGTLRTLLPDDQRGPSRRAPSRRLCVSMNALNCSKSLSHQEVRHADTSRRPG